MHHSFGVQSQHIDDIYQLNPSKRMQFPLQVRGSSKQITLK